MDLLVAGKLIGANVVSSTNNQPDEGHIKIRRTNLEGRESWYFSCEKESPASEIRQAMTMQLNERVNDCARLLNDERLLARLSGRDVVAQCCGTCLIVSSTEKGSS